MRRYLLSAVVVFAVASALGDSVTANRISKLPSADRTQWLTYLERSQALAKADQAALDAEVAANGMTSALRAPNGGDFKLPAKRGDSWRTGEEAGTLADIILSYQTPSGGWSKHTGYSKGPRKPGMQWTSQNEPGHSPHYVATFDNRSTTEQMYFLANMWQATKRDDCQAGFIRGLNFLFAAQYPNGGWPQVYPLENGYHDDITFNDDAMTHILELLYSITRNEARYAFLDDRQRQEAAAAFMAGIDCVLRMQIEQEGERTAWCAQHDALTLEPTSARKMEPATLSGLESARLLKFLMTVKDPKPDLVAGIEAGLKWLEDVKIAGVRRMKQNGKTVYVSDPASTQIFWARFYDLTNNQPVFPGRDGILYNTFDSMAAKNDLGYDYYTTLPGSIVRNGQKKWRKMLAAKP